MGDDPIESWKRQIQWYSENNHFKEMNRIDGMPTEFECKIFLGLTTFGLLEQIQKLMEDFKCEPEHFKGRIIFMSMYNDIAWDETGNQEGCEHKSLTVADYARKFPRGHWRFVEPGSEKKWYGTFSGRPDGSWDKTAEQMMMSFSESGHPIVRASSACERGELKKQRRWKEIYSLQWERPEHRVASPNGHFCESAQYLRSSGRYVQ